MAKTLEPTLTVGDIVLTKQDSPDTNACILDYAVSIQQSGTSKWDTGDNQFCSCLLSP